MATQSNESARPLIVFSCAPYAGSLARASLDLAMSFAVFAQQPRVLFTGESVFALLPGQKAQAMGLKSLRKVIDSLPLYDIEEILVDADSLAQHGLTEAELPPFAKQVDAAAQRDLMASASHVLSL